MKNRAIWLVLIVFAIATMLMVFFVMPRLSQDAAAPLTAAGDAATNAAAEVAGVADKVGRNLAEGAAEKMDRLRAEADAALTSMEGLFAEGRMPGVEAYSAAKALAQGAMAAAAQIEIPQGLDEAMTASLAKLREDAARTLTLIEALPADPAKAVAMIANLRQAFMGNEVVAQAPAPAADTRITPRFDILRVEPDGSTVIAGNAAPGSKVEIINGDTVIASLTVDGSGDFAAILDNPLPAGDYQLQIRATGEDGNTVTSEEVATVSVPEGGQGELLAIVSKPGEASRLITLPTAPAPEVAAPADTTVAVAAEPAGSAQGDTAAPSAVLTPDLPADAQALANSAPVIGGQMAAASPAAPPAAEAEAPAATVPTATPDIQVSAVEIEGDRIFVAGKGPAGASVRGYANDIVIGDDTVDASGNYVVSGTIDLPVGNHIINVELLDATGKVLVRASVPFDRPEGEQVAVVAQTAPVADGLQASVEEAEFDRLRFALSKAVAILQNLYAGGEPPAMDAVAAARSSVELGLAPIAGFRVPEGAPDRLVLRAATGAAKANDAMALLQTVRAGDVDGLGRILPQLADILSELMQPANPPAPLAASDDAASPPASAPTAATAEPRTIEQAPLAQSDNSVIIRRGDTLWQISRRVYGQGVRYTTIYLANANQIANPDRIEPGQIFVVPRDALPNAEEIHRRRLTGEPVN
ncbi:LysM peptidoglycan-binding domain-containing protein [Peteryoungia desertarenae]|uniref:LysM peptidoglycan-binding domain-containing protein n=2 Tax=Peteryoungia desertarenae TaxID=1813451 RepID=A0ABX6QRY9_9HYPH|nr:LysM peptidoglycan-binding domain-containing protein [Peteryoungia desertarenae]